MDARHRELYYYSVVLTLLSSSYNILYMSVVLHSGVFLRLKRNQIDFEKFLIFYAVVDNYVSAHVFDYFSNIEMSKYQKNIVFWAVK